LISRPRWGKQIGVKKVRWTVVDCGLRLAPAACGRVSLRVGRRLGARLTPKLMVAGVEPPGVAAVAVTARNAAPAASMHELAVATAPSPGGAAAVGVVPWGLITPATPVHVLAVATAGPSAVAVAVVTARPSPVAVAVVTDRPTTPAVPRHELAVCTGNHHGAVAVIAVVAQRPITPATPVHVLGVATAGPSAVAVAVVTARPSAVAVAVVLPDPRPERSPS
jgi:hypothetical protein